MLSPTSTPTRPVARFTVPAPGADPSDAARVDATLERLRSTDTGRALVDRLLAARARIVVVAESEFAQIGQAGAHAFYDPSARAIYLKREDLTDTRRDFAAVAVAHEAAHLLDDVGRVDRSWLDGAARGVAQLGGAHARAGIAAQEQAAFELTMIRETRAFLIAGQVARDLGVQLPASDPTTVAARGANDATTYGNVWNALLHSSYNPQGRTAPPHAW